MKSNIKDNIKCLLNKIELRANYLYKYHYRKYIHMDYNILMVENLMCSGHCHLVAVFKKYLIEDDNSEYLRRLYKYKESISRLKKLFSYHIETTVIFPNYTPLFESKYLYNNVIRKQRIIDAQQNLDVKKNNKKRKDFFYKDEKIFNSTIFGEILTQSESVLRIVFGIEKKQKKLKDKYTSLKNIQDDKIEIKENNNNISSNENSNYSDCKELNQLIKHVENVEKNINLEEKNKSISIKETLKYKLKLINTPNIDQKKHKNLEKLNNITNNSTNSIISSSNNNNNINNNINLKKIQNKPKDFKNNILQSKKSLKSSKKILENIKNQDSNIKHENLEYIKSKKNLTISPNVKNKSHIPNRTLYCSKFHINKNKVNNLMGQEKKLRIKNNSNSYSNNASRTKANINNANNNNIYLIIDKNIKSNKILKEIPNKDINKIESLFSNNNKVLTISNRNSNRNHNYILNNPNLFFAETEILKTERNIMKKRSQKKDIIKNFINQIITTSPSNSKSKGVFGRNNNRKIFIKNKPNLKLITENTNNKLYASNKNINTNIYESSKKLLINEYNFKNKSKNKKYNK